MKKLAKILATLSCCCIMCMSCDFDNYELDNSLTGSISYYYHAKIEGTFDGIPLIDDVDYHFSYARGCSIGKISNATVSFYCIYTWKMKDGKWERFKITIPELPVSGKPYDVTLDYVSQKASVIYDNDYNYVPNEIDDKYVEYHSVETSIKGWMKEISGMGSLTRTSLRHPEYDCDITISCTVDDKELTLKITKLIGG